MVKYLTKDLILKLNEKAVRLNKIPRRNDVAYGAHGS
jgi:hypothetical protein